MMTTTTAVPYADGVAPAMYPGPYAQKNPDKPAMIMADTQQVETYAQLEERSLRLANHYRTSGLQRGDHVAVVAENRFELVEVYHAAQRSGLLVTVVNYHLTAGEAGYILRNCEASSVAISARLPHAQQLAEVFATDAADAPELLSVGGNLPGCTPYEEALAASHAQRPGYEPRGTDMLYSSGTTGRPKGILPEVPEQPVEQVEGAGISSTFGVLMQWSSTSVYLSPAPLYHAAPIRYVHMTHCYGGTVIIMPHFDAQTALEAIEKYQVTHSQWVPTMFIRLLKLPAEVRGTYDVSSMQCIVHAAAPCPVDVKRKIIDWFGPIVWEYYASTEGNGATLVDSATWLQHPGTVGKGSGATIVHVLDSEFHELPAGQVGTIWFEDPTLPPFNYYKEPEKTAGTRHPDHPGWSTIGDLGHLDEEGFLYLAERQAYLIITGGVNIYPQEIENELALHPDVVDVAVDGLPDDELGQIVGAYITLEDGVVHTESTARAIVDWLGERLATYKLPRVVFFTSELPRTPTGKLQKRKLEPEAADAKFVLHA